MNNSKLVLTKLISILLFVGMSIGSLSASAADRTNLDNDIHSAIKLLLETSPAAKELANTAKGALVFPNVTKAGFMIGVQYGQGALVRRRADGDGYYIAAYYSLSAASYGFQAGAQSFGYVMALMTDRAVEQVEDSLGWELGVGPSIVVVDAGTAKTLTTTTAKKDVYAFTFGQKGLMAGLGLQGSKITRLAK